MRQTIERMPLAQQEVSCRASGRLRCGYGRHWQSAKRLPGHKIHYLPGGFE